MKKESKKAGTIASRERQRRLELGGLTEEVIGAAIEVQKSLGVGFLETVYEAALAVELRQRGIVFQSQVRVPILYRGVVVGIHRLDLLVEETLVVELKVSKSLENIHFAVVRSYLRASKLKHGLLINFATCPLEIRRVRTWT